MSEVIKEKAVVCKKCRVVVTDLERKNAQMLARVHTMITKHKSGRDVLLVTTNRASKLLSNGEYKFQQGF